MNPDYEPAQKIKDEIMEEYVKEEDETSLPDFSKLSISNPSSDQDNAPDLDEEDFVQKESKAALIESSPFYSHLQIARTKSAQIFLEASKKSES